MDLASLDSGCPRPSLILSAGAANFAFTLAFALLTALGNLDPPFKQVSEGKEQSSLSSRARYTQLQTKTESLCSQHETGKYSIDFRGEELSLQFSKDVSLL